MAEMLSLPRKYRPQTLDEFHGNDELKTTLRTVLSRPQGLPHCIYFIGPSGCGKTTLARIVAKEMGADPASILELNSANLRGIDDARMVINNCRYKPRKGPITFYILDEFHKVTNDAQNALLKLLEEPPSFVYFAICTTEPEKVIKTARQRGHVFTVSSLQALELAELVKEVSEKEGVAIPAQAPLRIGMKAQGSPRNALTILDMVIDIPDDDALMTAIENYIIIEASMENFCKALLEGRTWKSMIQLLRAIDVEPEQARRGICSYMTEVLLNSPGGNEKAHKLIEEFSEPYFNVGMAGLVFDCYKVCKLFAASGKI